MIRKNLLLLALTLITLNCFSQEKNELRIYYGISDAEFLRKENIEGAGSTELNSFSEFGIKYLKSLNEKLSLETGINYTNATIIINPAFTGEPVERKKENFEMISVPVFANYSLWNYFFINGGPLLDFQTSNNSTNSQDGIGYSIGIGGKVNIKNFSIFINPNYKRHSLIPFEKSNYHQKLTEFGVQMGLGYKF